LACPTAKLHLPHEHWSREKADSRGEELTAIRHSGIVV
jgi:hypothetical protein